MKILIEYICPECNYKWTEEGEGKPMDHSDCPECKTDHIKHNVYYPEEEWEVK